VLRTSLRHLKVQILPVLSPMIDCIYSASTMTQNHRDIQHKCVCKTQVRSENAIDAGVIRVSVSVSKQLRVPLALPHVVYSRLHLQRNTHAKDRIAHHP
jgi:hypothetical protein